ncbi:MAG: VacB/RNase II family 3'-5' exoribonuclease [Phycisphaerales bacterium]|nr:VacB/RNase II family 3'-5' exoribonuclease [Phycisphaerales bacterium]
MPLRYTNRIPDLLRRSDRGALTSRELADLLRVQQEDREVLDKALGILEGEESIEKGPDARWRLPQLGDTCEGTLKIARKGFGFVMPDVPCREGDIYIPRGALGDAISGDRVLVTVSRRKGMKGRGPSGRIEEVIERKQTSFAGTVQKRGKNWLIDPDGRSLQGMLIIRDPHARSINVGDKVVFELVASPEGDMLGEAAVTEVLGKAGKPDVETAAVIASFGLRTTFSSDVMESARSAASSFDASRDEIPSDREDLTESVIFTIDPPDARDFDDAISVSWDKQSKEWTLGVHIADVSSFVTCGDPMDEEARIRGNSVYLPRRVIPMLPEVLSNGVCSLQEGVNRFCKSAFISFDHRGKVIGQRFASTVIRSRKRMTYLEAQALIDGNDLEARRHMRSDTMCQPEVKEALLEANRLATALRNRRIRDGMIVLDLPEAELVFDQEGHVTDVTPEDDAFTHKLIEMFMVEANEAVARLFDGLELPLLRRIHPEPELDDVEELRTIAITLGYHLADSLTRSDLQRLLQETAGTPAARAVHFAVLRTLTRAEYSPAPVGHFALASTAYAHFTSPIRRYPDLLVHRALQAFLEATDNGKAKTGGRRRNELIDKLRDDSQVLDMASLVVLGRHCTDTEQNAEDAERYLRQFLVLQYLEAELVGEELPGVITGFSSSGVWIMLDRYLAEGIVNWDGMGTPGNRPDRWVRIEGTGQLVSSRSGAVLCMGDPVTVQLLRVDPTEREMDLLLKEHPHRKAQASPRPRRGARNTPKKSGKRKRRKGR